MKEIDKFVQTLNRKIGESQQAQLRFVNCKSVTWNDDERTMDATGVSDDAEYLGIQLGFGYVDIKPKVETTCLIGILEGKEALAFLINAENVELVEINADKIVFNGGNDYFVFADKLKSELEKNNQILQTILTTVATAVNEPGNGSPSAFQAALNLSLKGKQLGDFSQIKDEKLIH
ncbi:MAG: hypothetical protein LBN27_05885 [Prevotellaceae bacterium]|jgi:hypothetical protein|nr:hypothetical protein [Prevotellaceae bacterium]